MFNALAQATAKTLTGPPGGTSGQVSKVRAGSASLNQALKTYGRRAHLHAQIASQLLLLLLQGG